MNQEIIKTISEELNVRVHQIEAVLSLLEEGNTVPFIARYRKEKTGALDEDQIRTIDKYYQYQVNLLKRKEDVIRLIDEKGMLNEKLKTDILKATQLSEVEDLYRPYKEKRKTKATAAKAKGLEPLAKWILALNKGDILVEAKKYLNDDVLNVEDAIQGALDIIAEDIADDIKYRKFLKDMLYKGGILKTSEKKKHDDENKVYEMYYNYQEKVKTLVSHRILAINRAEKEKVINVQIEFNEEYIENFVKRRYVRYPNSPCAVYVNEAIVDGLKRLAYPSIERMVRSELSAKAHESSIDVFSMNLEKLLLQAPIKNKRILGFDPAFRTGCKLAVIDESGKMLCVDVIYPHQPNAKIKEAKTKLVKLIKDYDVSIIAIGNGTASRESETFVSNVISEYGLNVQYTIVSEAGASVYSASKLAIEEFPNLHVEQRSAISIARRLMDPLSELIKIDPQSIGVGQYQHDLPAARLKERLDFAVEKAVNLVGVNINTASPTLLKHVAGLTSAMANNIVTYRQENGKILSRQEIKKIPKIGTKSFEQSAGFLRIEDGKEMLDRTSIHPESYKYAKIVLDILGLDEHAMGTQIAQKAVDSCNKEELLKQIECDSYTLNDILDSIKQPLRDYRDNNDGPILRSDILELEDLHIHDKLQGTVRNVVDFGVFVDIGLHEDGLIHISQMADHKIGHPSEMVSVGDIIDVWVYKIDEEKHKVQLTMIP